MMQLPSWERSNQGLCSLFRNNINFTFESSDLTLPLPLKTAMSQYYFNVNKGSEQSSVQTIALSLLVLGGVLVKGAPVLKNMGQVNA